MTASRPTAVITGAARRVGRATAIELAAAGFDLIITCHRHRAEAEQTLERCRETANESAFSGEIHACDFSQPDHIAALCGRLAQRPRIDALVHNASVYRPSPLDELSIDELGEQYLVNAAAPAMLCRALAPTLAASSREGGGSIVCFSDIHVLGRPRRNYLAYAMSKAALTQMVEVLAIELAPRVRINAIAPGVVAWPENADPDMIAAYEARIPLDRPGTPQDAARMARWLVCEATYITGEIIRLDGGRWLR